MRRTLRSTLTVLTSAAALALPAGAVAAAPHGPPAPAIDLETQVLDADQSFRGLDAVDRDTAWVVGASVTGGAAGVWRTADGGRSGSRSARPGPRG